MRTVQIEVKTEHHIRFDFHDFVKIFEEAKTDPCRLHAFDNFDLGDDSVGNLQKCWESLDELSLFSKDYGKQHSINIQYIVRKLGFDEVQWYGMMSKDKKEYLVTAYNRGADI